MISTLALDISTNGLQIFEQSLNMYHRNIHTPLEP
jgi:hypothetical protein